MVQINPPKRDNWITLVIVKIFFLSRMAQTHLLAGAYKCCMSRMERSVVIVRDSAKKNMEVAMKVGFIGLGNVGAKLSGSLLRNGVDLTV